MKNRSLFALTSIAAAVAMTLAACDAKAPVAALPAASAPDAQAPDVQAAAAPPAAAVVTAPMQSRAPAPPSPRYSSQYSYVPPPSQVGGEQDYDPPQIYSAYEAPIDQPAPIAVPWAPPPMLVEAPPPPPSSDASWTGGYWVWHERWVWAPGRWADPPRPHYHWVPPYYEHRRDRVVFVDGFWSPHPPSSPARRRSSRPACA
jgi:hypothetical protein